ncbi:hypothetical protein F5B22DRAFT_56563 [Xylaria bambusicola]|uniref:uncharacterized protein n=1 Tax=Xylaria bambusicola TaxID=326684 RepID=UPI002008A5C7|nr:uncharacterized protein F5B22DRAFT_56563 [Xylaria bambusicola]KAI0520922.1 hypothetical protein F5B22DRAFT_56563 [Xylaria bambusicola]
MRGWRKMRSFLMSDEELGKKDDDHKLVGGARQRHSPSWQPSRGPPRRSIKRIGLVLAVALVVYLFVHNIPKLGPDDRMRRPEYARVPGRPASRLGHSSTENVMHPPDPDAQAQTRILAPDTTERNFNGPFKFLNLASTLQAISNLRGSQPENKNILFAAASLKSAATLLPMACQMGLGTRNYVHFALLGRTSIRMQQLWDINGIDKSCIIIFHDARPNYAEISTDGRLEKSVFRGLHHIHNYMHPQVIIVDGTNNEETFFTRGLKQHLKVSKTSLIELPRFAPKSLDWITRLDSAALRMWNTIKIDILIQATPKSSGSLIRLLRSLSTADYTSSAIPHITIELPYQIDTNTKRFLDSFVWPPSHVSNPTNERYISLRRRLSRQKSTEEEASTRFFESFWPAQPQKSHVLVLSPHAEVTPQYFNCKSKVTKLIHDRSNRILADLKYTLLEYRYSDMSRFHNWGQHLFGISLEQPSTTLDGEKLFNPPLFQHPEEISAEGTPNPFLWQTPTSSAVLFLGDKWMELHDFVSRTMQVKENSDVVPTLLSEKLVSKQHPSWLEHALRLARVRGYWFLYPGKEVAEHVAAVHGELYDIPEEYTGFKTSVSDDASDEAVGNIRQKVRWAPEVQLSSLSVLDALPNDGNLWPLTALPIADWQGTEVSPQDFRTRSYEYEVLFKGSVGRCDAETGKGQKAYETASTQDLFCNLP